MADVLQGLWELGQSFWYGHKSLCKALNIIFCPNPTSPTPLSSPQSMPWPPLWQFLLLWIMLFKYLILLKSILLIFPYQSSPSELCPATWGTSCSITTVHRLDSSSQLRQVSGSCHPLKPEITFSCALCPVRDGGLDVLSVSATAWPGITECPLLYSLFRRNSLNPLLSLQTNSY